MSRIRILSIEQSLEAFKSLLATVKQQLGVVSPQVTMDSKS